MTSDGQLSDKHIITENTIALLHAYVASSLDAGISALLEKKPLYDQNVCMLKKMDSKEGRRDRRKESAELLSKWHGTLKDATKKRKAAPPVGVSLSYRSMMTAFYEVKCGLDS